MKIYAIKDRMIDYFMTPFTGESDRQVQAGLAQTINNPGNMNAIAQTPHHFELWQLGEVNEDTGKITEHREFIADCSSLVRPSIRGPGKSGETEGQGTTGRRTAPPSGVRAGTSPNPGSAQDAPQADPGALQEARPGPGGIYRQHSPDIGR